VLHKKAVKKKCVPAKIAVSAAAKKKLKSSRKVTERREKQITA